MLSSENSTELLGDTTYTKIFVGGLAWETQKDTLKRYFEQFGEIHEAVVITDRSSGKSKGYGFVTFKDPESARRACLNPYPVIDGRRANCNLAYLGAQKNHPTVPDQHHHGMEKIRQPAIPMATSSPVHGNSKYFPQLVHQYPFPYSAYGYPVYSQQIDAMNYYNAYGRVQPLPSYYTNWASRFPGVYTNYYPFFAQQPEQHSYSSQSQYPKIVHFPHLPKQYTALGTLSLPASPSPSITGPATEMVTAVGKAPAAAASKTEFIGLTVLSKNTNSGSKGPLATAIQKNCEDERNM